MLLHKRVRRTRLPKKAINEAAAQYAQGDRSAGETLIRSIYPLLVHAVRQSGIPVKFVDDTMQDAVVGVLELAQRHDHDGQKPFFASCMNSIKYIVRRSIRRRTYVVHYPEYDVTERAFMRLKDEDPNWDAGLTPQARYKVLSQNQSVQRFDSPVYRNSTDSMHELWGHEDAAYDVVDRRMTLRALARRGELSGRQRRVLSAWARGVTDRAQGVTEGCSYQAIQSCRTGALRRLQRGIK